MVQAGLFLAGCILALFSLAMILLAGFHVLAIGHAATNIIEAVLVIAVILIGSGFLGAVRKVGRNPGP